MGKVIALCGKSGSGKSTLSKYIQKKYNAIPFSADQYMLRLFGEIKDRDVFEEKLSLCKELIYEVSQEILKYTNVVYDFGFWHKNERDYLRQKFEGDLVFIYLRLKDEKILSQIERRNSQLADGEYYMDQSTYETLASMFEEPTDKEEVITYTNKDILERDLLGILLEGFHIVRSC